MGKAVAAFPVFCSERLKARRKKLENEPQPELHLAREVPLGVDNSEGTRSGWIDAKACLCISNGRI